MRSKKTIIKRIPHFKSHFQQLLSVVEEVIELFCEALYILYRFLYIIPNTVKFCSDKKRIKRLKIVQKQLQTMKVNALELFFATPFMF